MALTPIVKTPASRPAEKIKNTLQAKRKTPAVLRYMKDLNLMEDEGMSPVIDA
jgi:hypothetical protein